MRKDILAIIREAIGECDVRLVTQHHFCQLHGMPLAVGKVLVEEGHVTSLKTSGNTYVVIPQLYPSPVLDWDAIRKDAITRPMDGIHD